MKFARKYQAKYPNSMEILQKDERELLAFYDFPAERRQSIRITGPYKSAFATIRNRARQTQGGLTLANLLTVMFKLANCAKQKWRRLLHCEIVGEVITEARF